jgi:hypothetical protein
MSTIVSGFCSVPTGKDGRENIAATTPKLSVTREPMTFSNRIVPVNSAPPEFNPGRGLPQGFLELLAPLHSALPLRQRALVERSDVAVAEAHAGQASGLPAALGRHRARGFAIRRRSFSSSSNEELDRLLRETAQDNDPQAARKVREARGMSEEMIRCAEFNPA